MDMNIIAATTLNHDSYLWHQDHKIKVIESEQKILVGGILKFHGQLEKVDGYDHVIFPPVYNQVGDGDDDDGDDDDDNNDDDDDDDDDDMFRW